jgi:hypothetical protein
MVSRSSAVTGLNSEIAVGLVKQFGHGLSQSSDELVIHIDLSINSRNPAGDGGWSGDVPGTSLNRSSGRRRAGILPASGKFAIAAKGRRIRCLHWISIRGG